MEWLVEQPERAGARNIEVISQTEKARNGKIGEAVKDQEEIFSRKLASQRISGRFLAKRKISTIRKLDLLSPIWKPDLASTSRKPDRSSPIWKPDLASPIWKPDLSLPNPKPDLASTIRKLDLASSIRKPDLASSDYLAHIMQRTWDHLVNNSKIVRLTPSVNSKITAEYISSIRQPDKIKMKNISKIFRAVGSTAKKTKTDDKNLHLFYMPDQPKFVETILATDTFILNPNPNPNPNPQIMMNLYLVILLNSPIL